ncbi:unnamed protein product [Paramecium sonneborni]|uniref:Uncharacterized protein n=1 Tax=Paramecium sonneborni TaxID=65129 RepID=A0A8S1RQF5_9CILI|nr:unnamed protein product [Paramecium sonneborni]
MMVYLVYGLKKLVIKQELFDVLQLLELVLIILLVSQPIYLVHLSLMELLVKNLKLHVNNTQEVILVQKLQTINIQ